MSLEGKYGSFSLSNMIKVNDGQLGEFPGPGRMTFPRLRLIASRVDLRMFPIPIRVLVDEDIAADRTRVVVRYKAAQDRADGRPTDIISNQSYPSNKIAAMNDDEVVGLLFDNVKRAVVHELEECFLVCGQRVRDPHWNEGAFDIGEQPPFKLPDPLPPELPRELPRAPRGETIKLIGPVGAPSLRAAFNGENAATHAPVYEYLPTGELVGSPERPRYVRREPVGEP